MQFLDRLTVKFRMFITFIFIGVIVILFGLFSMSEMKTLGKLTSTLYEHPLRVSNAALKAQGGIIRMHRSMKDVLLSNNEFEIQEAIRRIQEQEALVYKQMDVIQTYILGKEGKDLEAETRDAISQWKSIRLKVQYLLHQGKRKEAESIVQESTEHVRKLENKMDALTKYARNKADGFMNNALKVQENITRNTVLMMIGIVLILFLLALTVIRHMVYRLGELQKSVSKISDTGEMKEVPVAGSNEISSLAESFNDLIKSLRKQFWIREGINVLNEQLAEVETLTDIAEVGINFISRHMEACAGALFIYDPESKTNEMQSSFALVERRYLGNSFAEGEGIVGQVARERKSIILTGIGEDDAAMQSGTVNESAKSLIALPLIYHGELLGVIEILSMSEIDRVKHDFMEAVAVVLANSINNSRQREYIDNLYEETRSANRELELQSAALEEANDKLGLRNEELRAQSEELQEQSKELQDLAEELTFQKNELEIKRIQVEEADRLKSEFLSNMSHELRTPLNSILALSQLMMTKGTGNDVLKELEFLRVIERNGRHLLSLINDILDLSKIESGRMDIFPTEFIPEEIITDVLSTMEPLINEKSLNLNTKIHYRGSVFSDQDKFRQIALNLLSNAVKFTANGEISVDLSLERDRLVLVVADTGIGIAENDINTIFDEFRQVDGSTSRRHEGTGLGLAICKKLSRILGGDLLVESTLDQGSTFKLSIPAAASGIVNAPESKVAVSAGAAQTTTAGTILVVDDDPDARALINTYLSRSGYRVIEASNGLDALDIAKSDELFAITLDIVMPGMDGWEVLRQLKLNDKTKSIPVIIISIGNDMTTGMALGASGYVEKPVERERLLEEINRIDAGNSINTILIVDDDSTVRTQISSILNNAGYSTIEAEGGKEGLEKAHKNRPDAMILDLMMPEVDGFQVLDSLAEEKALNYLPVIVVTAKDLDNRDKEAILKRTRSVIQKGDMELNGLFNKIERELKAIKKPLPIPVQLVSSREVLVVEDNEIAAMQITTTLEEINCKVTHAVDGDEAIWAVQQCIPDLIILDLMMPGINGFEVLENIRSKPETELLPVIVLTAKELTSADRANLSNNNVKQFIRKGALDRKQLKNQVLKALTQSSNKETISVQENTALNSRDLRSAEGKINVLVVEDNEDNIFTLKEVLADYEGEIKFVKDGESGVEQARKLIPDLILMDIQLPGMNGLEATRIIKREPELAAIPVIALTARAMKENLEEIYASGCDDIITKPFNPDDFLEKMLYWANK